MNNHLLNEKFFASYDQHLEAVDAHYASSNHLQLADQIIPNGQMQKLVTWMDHNAHVEGSTVYLMEVSPLLDKPHPVQQDFRVFIALGAFDRKVDPKLPYWCHVRNHYPVNLEVDLLITDTVGVPITHACLTAFKSFDRSRTYDQSISRSNNHRNHHGIHTGIIDQSGKVIFENYTNIRQWAMAGIRLLAERQIMQEDTELSAVWLLAGLKADVTWEVENHVDIMKAIEVFRPRSSDGYRDNV